MDDLFKNPCKGKECKDCERCIYDMEIPTYKQETKQTMSEICNYCKALFRDYCLTNSNRFMARCKNACYDGADGTRHPRIIDAEAYAMKNILKPTWCPLMKTTSMVPSVSPYQSKKDKMKSLPRKVKWEDIKEGEIYVIPKIQFQARQIIKIDYKNDVFCRCHKVDENGKIGYETVNLYENDVDAIMLSRIHEF